jgi:hypothetical protein
MRKLFWRRERSALRRWRTKAAPVPRSSNPLGCDQVNKTWIDLITAGEKKRRQNGKEGGDSLKDIQAEIRPLQ